MKIRFTYISLALALAACSSDKEPAQPIISEENPVYMTFSVSVEGTGDTRATRGENDLVPDGTIDWGHIDKDQDGNAFECTLLSDYFTPVIVVPDNNDASGKAFTKVGEFKILSYWKDTDPNTNITTYTIHGSFDTTNSQYDTVEKLKAINSNARLMVFANSGSDPLAHTSNFGAHIFTARSGEDSLTDDSSEGFEAIPMWGVSQVDFSNLKQGSYTTINPNHPCSLLRAMAKVQINLALPEDYSNEVKIISVELNRVNPNGYVVPGTDQVWTKYLNTTSIPINDSFNECSNGVLTATPAVDGENQPILDDKGNQKMINPFITKKIRNVGLESTNAQYQKNGDYVAFYIPEIKNVNSKEECLELTINYTVGSADNLKTNHLYFTKYSGGGPVKVGNDYQYGLWDVVRNHIYEYNITGVQDSKINIEARVKDWKYYKEVQPLEPNE